MRMLPSPFAALMLAMAVIVPGIVPGIIPGIAPGVAFAQRPPAGPVAVGVIRAQKQPITETSEFVGRILATDRVALVARVTAFLEKRDFTEGSEVSKGDLLYQLEQAPFQADVAAKQAVVQQTQAQLQNATLAYNRATSLLKTPAGQQSNVDDARATMLSDAAQVQNAQAQLQTSQINLAYTTIHAPIDGKIGRSSVTVGNVVSPSSGTLATIVSQDPMYVVFPISLRTGLELRDRYADKGGFSAVVIKLRLPNGKIYGHDGTLNFVDNTVSPTTDTIILRGTVPNPKLQSDEVGHATVRELVDGEFVTVLLQGVQPVELVTVPRAAVLSDQRGDYVFTVDAQNKVAQTRIQLGQSTPGTASVISGLDAGTMVIVDGVQRVRPGQVVQPGPASPPVTASPVTLQGGAGGPPAAKTSDGSASATPANGGK